MKTKIFALLMFLNVYNVSAYDKAFLGETLESLQGQIENIHTKRGRLHHLDKWLLNYNLEKLADAIQDIEENESIDEAMREEVDAVIKAATEILAPSFDDGGRV